jgi:stage III sporulation protein AB
LSIVRLLLRGSGAALLVFCGWYAGALHQRSLRTRRMELEQTEQLLQRIRQEIAYRHRALDQLYQLLAAEGSMACFMPEDTGAEIAASFQTLSPPQSFSADEKACFVECMADLGHTEAQQECERLNYFLQRFAQFRLQAKEAEQKAAALDLKLGFAAGAVLALLLL